MPQTTVFGGTDTVFRTKMSYDTGSDSIFIHPDEYSLLIPHYLISPIDVETVDGLRNLPRVPGLEARVVTTTSEHDAVLLDWTGMEGIVNESRHRIGSELLDDNLFVCSHPGLNKLYVAKNKTNLIARMPA